MAMAKAKRSLTVGLAAVGLIGFVTASQWGYAAEPPAHSAPATPEMMQLVRDEHDLVADMICMSSEHFGPWFGNLREYLAHLV